MKPYTAPARAHAPAHAGFRTLLACLALPLALLASCGGHNQPGDTQTYTNASGEASKIVVLNAALSHPWGLAFMPDGRMLVTERSGQMRLVSADGQTVSEPITQGLPPIKAQSQGGLLDVQLDPDYATQPWIYWTYSEPGEGDVAGTAVARGQLLNGEMVKVEVIFRQQPKVPGNGHFGSRLVFARDKTLFVTLGERMTDQPGAPGLDNAQNLSKHLGKVVHIQRDGQPAPNNPFLNTPGALPEIWSLGHRNPQGAALHPQTGELWLSEHGPQGGDEINRVQPGHNYGWPLRSYGCPYGSQPADASCQVNGGKHAPDFDEPLTTWVPFSIAPSGMAFYTGNKVAAWQGQLFIGALEGKALWKLTLDGNRITRKEVLVDFNSLSGDLAKARVRDVRQGPDGWLYVLTDSEPGFILRIEQETSLAGQGNK